MKYRALLFISFSFFTNCFSQEKNYKIIYRHCVQYDTSRTITDTLEGADFFLIGNSKQSIYKYAKKVLTDEERRKRYSPGAIPVKDADAAVQFKSSKGIPQSDKGIDLNYTEPGAKDSIDNLLLWDKESDSVFIHKNMTKEFVNISEKNPVINWNITDETKKVKTYNCQKATTHFRGRNYTIWFTSDIAISDGPWKFKGLPGLVMDLKDDKNQVRIYAETIEYPSDVTIPKISFANMPGKWITMAKYIVYQNEVVQKKLDGFLELEDNSLPAGFKGNVKIARTGYYDIEKKLD